MSDAGVPGQTASPNWKPCPLAEKVYLILKEAIVHGKLPQGMWPQEEVLTKALDVSRTPVREALNRLKSDRLVEISPRRGTHIIDLSDSELGQLFEVREKVEMVFFVRSARPFLKPRSVSLGRAWSLANRRCAATFQTRNGGLGIGRNT